MSYINRINEIVSLSGKRNYKYLRNLQLYTNSPNYSLNNMTDSEVEGYFNTFSSWQERDTTAPIAENIVKSCIDTLKAMVAYYKVRPFFNPYNGTVKDIRVAKQVQQFFDFAYDKWSMNDLVSNVFKDACIFDTGYIYIDQEVEKPVRALPWQVYYDPRQVNYNKVYEVVYRQAQYPLINKGKVEYVTRYLYWNTLAHKKVEYIQEKQKEVVTEYESDMLPFKYIHYSSPVKGMSNMSVCDMLWGIQQEITSITNRLKDAEEKCPISILAIPEDSDIDANKISNRVMQMVPYRTDGPGAATPIVPILLEPYSQRFTERLEQLKQEALQQVGLTESSVQAAHQPGVNSGVAMGTLQNIEAQRFQAQTNAVINLYTEVACACIELFKGNILPESKYVTPLTWSDVRKARNNLNIQYSAAEALSKDPSEKYKLLKEMKNDGLLPASEILGLMELPDLQRGYNISNNVHNAVMTVIENCIDNDDYDIPIFIPREVLKSEIRSCCLNLEAINNEKNKKDIDRLLKLYDKVVEFDQMQAEQQNNNDIANQQTQQINQQTAALDQQSAMLDPELSQMQSVVQAIQSGQMDQATAQQYLAQLQGGQQNGQLVQ